jgi:hypothetical protein
MVQTGWINSGTAQRFFLIFLLMFSFFKASEYIEGGSFRSSRGWVEPSHFGQPPSLIACRSIVLCRARRQKPSHSSAPHVCFEADQGVIDYLWETRHSNDITASEAKTRFSGERFENLYRGWKAGRVTPADIRQEFGGADHPVTVHFGTELLRRIGDPQRDPDGKG